MNRFHAYTGVAPHAWLQHHLPWLGLFALIVGLFRDEAGVDTDQLNG